MKSTEIDNAYEARKDCMTVQERINYCVKLIYDLHGQLNRSADPPTGSSRSSSLRMLQDVRAELHQLMTQGIV